MAAPPAATRRGYSAHHNRPLAGPCAKSGRRLTPALACATMSHGPPSTETTAVTFSRSVWLLGLATLLTFTLPAGSAEKPRPNVVLILTDDQGYADVGCYGAKGIATPNLDRMAREGVRFSDFYVAQPVCSASRAALLTGCYPNRVAILGALGPTSPLGLGPGERTVADLLKARGYATAAYGKWHLGHRPSSLPT